MKLSKRSFYCPRLGYAHQCDPRRRAQRACCIHFGLHMAHGLRAASQPSNHLGALDLFLIFEATSQVHMFVAPSNFKNVIFDTIVIS